MYTFYILLGLAHEFQNDMLVAKLIFHCARSILRNWLGSEHEFGSAAGAAATGSVEWSRHRHIVMHLCVLCRLWRISHPDVCLATF